jgi:SAM-dependent methyltransferase
MSSPTLTEWERIEAERSASEASHIDTARLVANERQVARYLAPPAETCYPLEYSYHLLGDVRGKVVLEYGCGDGLNTLALARRGALVKALDISPELIEVARRRMEVNGADANVEFVVGSAHDMPLEDESVDVVFGIAILHHLDLKLSAREVRRVLRKGGRAIFQEPVRNSGFVKFVRGLIPYKSPDVSPFERPLSDRELAEYADGFSSYRSKAFTLPTTNLVNILPPLEKRLGDACYHLDAAVLRALPPLAHFATVRVVEMVK